MKLSSKTTYGTRALLNIAARQGEGPVLLKDVARQEAIPEQYLEQVVAPLRIAGLVKSQRGPGGGFTLARPPSEVTLGDVVQILEGSCYLVNCVDAPETCVRSAGCVTRDLWQEMGLAMRKVLQSVTLQDLVDRQRDKHHGSMYHI
ncbi:MAG: Rrf2 family transcriptional regulator [Dehalococcoidia bacterium]|nr:Rrf2 family transcriptional regulator [Dehalococcoidia bacterium]